MEIKITNIKVVLLPSGMDNIVIVTDKPSSIPHYPEKTEFVAWAQRDYGETWVKQNFPDVPYEVINGRKEDTHKFSESFDVT